MKVFNPETPFHSSTFRQSLGDLGLRGSWLWVSGLECGRVGRRACKELCMQARSANSKHGTWYARMTVRVMLVGNVNLSISSHDVYPNLR